MEIQSKLINKKIKLFIIIFLFGFLLIIARLFYLQVSITFNLFLLSQKNFLRYSKVAPVRGNILDINGKLIATNRPVTSIQWQGSGKRLTTSNVVEDIKALEEILDIQIASKPEFIAAEKLGTSLIIKEDIPFEQLSKIAEKFSSSQNIQIIKSFKRFYPKNRLACHIIGYLGYMNMEQEGRMGLEKLYHEKLKGIPGEVVKTINSVGKKLEQKEVKLPVAGDNINTTIDLDLQICAEAVFPENFAGAMILIDSQDGSILAMVSRPDFDPSLFLEPIGFTQWQELIEQKCFLNRALHPYPPASLFKLVTMATGLEEGLIDINSTWHCNGKIFFGGRTIHCHNHYGHGLITFKQSLAQSCNIPFFDIGKHIKIDLLADYAHRFGLGKKTGFIFPEHAGLVPTSEWKKKTKGEPWWPGETLSCTIGQSYNLVTPIQIARMISAIFNGYLVVPRILQDEPIVKSKLNISSSTLKQIKKAMKLAIKKGTASRLNKFKELKIYAKTGTAQTSDLSKQELGQKYVPHAWFVANFQYKKEKPLTLVIFIEHAGTAKFATSIAKKFFFDFCEIKNTGKTV